jgi:hypothetical protein
MSSGKRTIDNKIAADIETWNYAVEGLEAI